MVSANPASTDIHDDRPLEGPIFGLRICPHCGGDVVYEIVSEVVARLIPDQESA